MVYLTWYRLPNLRRGIERLWSFFITPTCVHYFFISRICVSILESGCVIEVSLASRMWWQPGGCITPRNGCKWRSVTAGQLLLGLSVDHRRGLAVASVRQCGDSGRRLENVGSPCPVPVHFIRVWKFHIEVSKSLFFRFHKEIHTINFRVNLT